jgi:hypothetical protein
VEDLAVEVEAVAEARHLVEVHQVAVVLEEVFNI